MCVRAMAMNSIGSTIGILCKQCKSVRRCRREGTRVGTRCAFCSFVRVCVCVWCYFIAYILHGYDLADALHPSSTHSLAYSHTTQSFVLSYFKFQFYFFSLTRNDFIRCSTWQNDYALHKHTSHTIACSVVGRIHNVRITAASNLKRWEEKKMRITTKNDTHTCTRRPNSEHIHRIVCFCCCRRKA